LVHEILERLPSGSLVLDLGCRDGSFSAPGHLTVLRADLDPPIPAHANFVRCNAAALPFRDHSIHAIICNHSLEHFEELDSSIAEIVRVLAPAGYLYVAVPDSSTITDRFYRWLGRGGGHVNAFSAVSMIPARIAAAGGPSLAGTRVLCTSLAFLNRRNIAGKQQRKLLLVANGNESFLRFLTLALRCLDRLFRTRASIYGWAYYFGEVPGLDLSISTNVCVKCGSAHPSWWLEHTGKVSRMLGLRAYSCPICDTRNFFTADANWQQLR
jgi:SAM-dependent methyltransferase